MLTIFDLASEDALRTGDNSWLKNLKEIAKEDTFEPFVNSVGRLEEIKSFITIMQIKHGMYSGDTIYMKMHGCNVIPLEIGHFQRKLNEATYTKLLNKQFHDGLIKFYFKK